MNSSFFHLNTLLQKHEGAFLRAIASKGISLRDQLIPDGKIHRFAHAGRGHKDCWYGFYGLAGTFGDWSRGIHETWSLKQEVLPIKDVGILRHQIAQANRKAEEERLKKQEEVATSALAQWDTLIKEGSSPYLIQKQVEAFGIRFEGEKIVVPVRDISGKLWSLQWISSDGTKRFLTAGRKKGCFHTLSTLEDGKPIYVTEGYATGASVYRATGLTTVVAFDAGNLDSVIEEVRKAYPQSPLILAGDDDRWKDSNMGREKAMEAAQKYGCSVVFPHFKETDAKPTDFNDLHVLEGVEEVKAQLEQAQLLPVSAEQDLDVLPINNTLLPVLPFTLEMIPEPFRNWIKDIAHRRQCPIDFVAIPAVLMIASLIGARCAIKPNAKDDWTVVPNLWGGILGDPGTLKSPVCSDVLFPFGPLELEAKEKYFEQKNTYEAEKVIFLETKKSLEAKIKAALEKNEGSDFLFEEGNPSSLKEKLASLLKNTPTEPVLKRYKVSDTTVEKIHEILSQNPGGVLVFRDELMGFLDSWEKKGHESDRSFYLEAWNGDKSYTIDRIGRGMVHASNICVSLLGTTQPDKIAAYLKRALKDLENDGLLQRFQLLVYPDKKPWALVDERPCPFARGRVLHICKTLSSMKFTDVGAREEEATYEGQHIIPFFRFSHEAQTFFHEWLTQLQKKLETPDHPFILQHLSKYRSLMPSLSLIFHLIRVADKTGGGDVSLEAAAQAAAWCEYLESHARRIYGMGIEATLPKADELLAWMRKYPNSPEKPLKRRFILRHSKFRSLKDLLPLLADLVEMGYIAEDQKGGFWGVG